MAAPSVVARKKTKKTDTGCIVGKETIPVIKYVNQCTMHICGMDFSSLASYWQIKALLMLEPSVVTPQNQYFPANSERMSVHCLESGCIAKYTHLGPRDFPRVGILHPSGNISVLRGCISHSLIIIREVLILTLSIFIAL